MAGEFRLPELGEGIEEGEVTKLMVAVGDTIAEDQPVIELETGKATVEVPSTVSGTVSEIAVSEGSTVKVGDLILTVGEGESAPQEKTEEQKAEPEEEPAEAPPEESEKAPEPKAEKKPEKEAGKPESAPKKTPKTAKQDAPAAPSARKFAREIGIDIAQVPGSGDNGRISVEDVKAYAKQLNEGRSTAPSAGAAVVPDLPDFSKWGEVRRESMNKVRKMTAQHMALCWSQIPHVTQFDRADITELDELRKKFAPRAEKAGGKLTMTAMLAKIVASALKVFPDFNASIDIGREEIIYKDYINVGIAVDTPRGLLVPVLRDTEDKNMIELAVEIGEIAKLARDGKISPDQLQGGTFTITNLGGIGGTHFTPIVNFPEVAILGVGRAYMEPSVKESLCKPRLTLPLSLSYDHRLIDGASGARFLRWIVDAIEEPLLLSLEG